MSKYPPAEPGALGVGPLKAAVGVANATPNFFRHLKVAAQTVGLAEQGEDGLSLVTSP